MAEQKIAKYCKNIDYTSLFHVGNLLTELNIERKRISDTIIDLDNNLSESDLETKSNSNSNEELDKDEESNEEYTSLSYKNYYNKKSNSASNLFQNQISTESSDQLDKIEENFDKKEYSSFKSIESIEKNKNDTENNELKSNYTEDENKLINQDELIENKLNDQNDLNKSDSKIINQDELNDIENKSINQDELKSQSTKLDVFNNKNTTEISFDQLNNKKTKILNLITEECESKLMISNYTNQYTAIEFVDNIKKIVNKYNKFDIHSKFQLLKDLCDCLIHYWLHLNQLHKLNRDCVYELLFTNLNQFKMIDLPFCLYVISSLNLCDDLYDSLMQLGSSRLDQLIDMYIYIFDFVFCNEDIDQYDEIHLKFSIINYKFNSQQIFQLNSMFSFILIKSLFKNKNNSDSIQKYLNYLQKLMQSIKTSDASIQFIAYGHIRLYNFLIEQFLDDSIEIAAKTVGLYSKFNTKQKMETIYIFSVKLENERPIFNSCYNIVNSLFETVKNEKDIKLLDNLSMNTRKKILTVQFRNQELIDVWNLIKKPFVDKEIKFTKYDFITELNEDDKKIIYEPNYIFNYISNEKNGYLFLAYCYLKYNDIDKIKELINQLDLDIFVHPKICFLFAERLFIEENEYYLNLFLNLIAKLDKKATRVYIEFHFKHFKFHKLANINMFDKREFLNKADSKNSKELKIELIKSALLDPTQTIYHLLTKSSFSNKSLLTCICELLCNEFKIISNHKMTKDKLTINFLTLLINHKMMKFDYQELESLIYFIKFLIFFTSFNNYENPIEFENLFLVVIQNENLFDFELLKKKIYFLQIITDLCIKLKIEFKIIDQHFAPIAFYLLQWIDKFWLNDVVSKMFTIKVLNFFKDKVNKLDKKGQKFIRSNIKLKNKIVLFYLADYYEENLNDLMDKEDINQLMYLYSINGNHEILNYLDKRTFDGKLDANTEKLIYEFLINNQRVLTLDEHFRLFNFLIDYLPINKLILIYLNAGIQKEIRYSFEVVNHIVKLSLFQSGTKLNLLLQEDKDKYLVYVKEIYKNLVDSKDKIIKLYNGLKYDNFLIEINKFIKNCEN